MKEKICIVGLGYVGLPLAIEFSKKYNVVGYDINTSRINQLNRGNDTTNEIKSFNKKKIFFTHDLKSIKNCNIFIITVPTPVNKKNNPDLKLLKNATNYVAKNLKHNDLVVYESTVHPGATNDICIPILEKKSNLKCHINNCKDKNFFLCGYSPERINPGDHKHTLTKVKKLVSGSSDLALKKINNLYKKIGIDVYPTESIKIAEAAKIIENTQRDLNIALINELSIIFDKMNLNTFKILKAAGTKWNFLKFQPGMVGGHCIGVDPYYLTHAIKKIGYEPKLILAGRKTNDDMSKFIYKKFVRKVKNSKLNLKKLKILIMGITFKENCTDIRNSKVYDLYKLLIQKKHSVDVFDPYASRLEVLNVYNINLKSKIKKNYYDGIIITVPHKKFRNIGIKKILAYGKKKRIVFDIKNLFNNNKFVDLTL